MKIKDLPKSDRPREKLIAKEAKNLKDSELLAILLRTGTTGKNVIEIAKEILGSNLRLASRAVRGEPVFPYLSALRAAESVG